MHDEELEDIENTAQDLFRAIIKQIPNKLFFQNLYTELIEWFQIKWN